MTSRWGAEHAWHWGGAGLAVERMAAMLKVALGLLSAIPTRVYTHHGHADVALTS